MTAMLVISQVSKPSNHQASYFHVYIFCVHFIFLNSVLFIFSSPDDKIHLGYLYALDVQKVECVYILLTSDIKNDFSS